MKKSYNRENRRPLHPFRTAAILFIFSLAGCSQTKKKGDESGPAEISHKVIVQGLQYPWELVWGPDNFIWMTERYGKISRVNPVTGAVIPLLTIGEVVSNGEGGLLGMALHPDFARHPEVFVSYNYNAAGNYREKIVRFRYNGSTLVEPVTILDNIAASYIHNGCRLLIGEDQKLYISTGDASNQSLPQDKLSLNGKILRLNLDGTVPADNPVAGNPCWTFGHRNAQGMVVAHSILYSSEHGPSNDDEVNIIEKGRNYGWPAVEGYCNTSSEKIFCSANNVKEPIRTWTPTAAVCGLDYYNNDRIPAWKNSLLLVALKNARLYQLRLDGSFRRIISSEEYLENIYGRLRDVCVAPNGKVYICTSNGGNADRIIEIKEKK